MLTGFTFFAQTFGLEVLSSGCGFRNRCFSEEWGGGFRALGFGDVIGVQTKDAGPLTMI